jgi:hypothetical protein
MIALIIAVTIRSGCVPIVPSSYGVVIEDRRAVVWMIAARAMVPVGSGRQGVCES